MSEQSRLHDAASDPDPLAGLAWLDPVVGLGGCLGRPALFAKMLDVFLKTHAESPSSLALAAQGEAQALAQLPKMAHALKGSVPAIGLLRLGELARRIDAQTKAGSPPGTQEAAALQHAMEHSLVAASEHLRQVKQD